MRDTEVNNLIINELTKAEFDSAEKSETELYFVTDEKIQTSDIEGLETALSGKQDVITDLATIRDGASKGATALQSVPSEYVTETELEAYHDTTKQDLLVSGTNIKTINNESILGEGNIEIKSALPTYDESTETLIFGGI